ncbi:DUF4920 domain-containing protein [Ferrimonas senticii]|uniref:DUF4920 domain-containing protein n=1 Tax=Ferrimonas senticii TaxID=394566 RepID=UPI00041B01DC|nr:DUF4920 domain-containing protein [Ferrimonas senticii]
MSVRTTALLCAALAAVNAHAALQFGEPVKPQLLVEVSTVLADPQAYVGKELTIDGEVTAVCKKAGCWMQIVAADNSGKLRVKVKDGVMVFPVSSIGQSAQVTGTLQGIPMDLAQTRNYYAHIAEEQGEAFDPASITSAISLYQIVPSGVSIDE